MRLQRLTNTLFFILLIVILNVAGSSAETIIPTLSLDSVGVLSGYNARITVTTTNLPPIGGFDLLISYEEIGVVNFLFAEAVGVLSASDWEYFTYRYSLPGPDEPNQSIRYVQLHGIADLPNSIAPDPETYWLDGEIIRLTFSVTNALEYIGSCAEISWAWNDCTNNTLSSIDGDSVFLAQNVESMLPDSNCLDVANTLPIVDFESGTICIVPPPDDRPHRQGDCNDDDELTPEDIIWWIEYVFRDGQPPITEAMCDDLCRLDFNCDEHVNIADVATMIRFVYHPPQPRPCPIIIIW